MISQDEQPHEISLSVFEGKGNIKQELCGYFQTQQRFSFNWKIIKKSSLVVLMVCKQLKHKLNIQSR